MTYFARSASDGTDDWPFWYVAETHNPRLNVLRKAWEAATGEELRAGAVLTDKQSALWIADTANAKLGGKAE